MSVYLTIPQAAVRVRRTENTIRGWINGGDLTAVEHRRQRYVTEEQLLDVERAKRQAQQATRIPAQATHQETHVPSTTAQDLLWIDVETTGLDPSQDRLLEVGLAVTTADLQIKARRSWIVGYKPLSAARMRLDAPPAVRDMHDDSGLWHAVAAPHALTWHALAPDIETWIRDNGMLLPLAGSSVHFDRTWLTEWMPQLAALTSYRNVDVSTLKELLARWSPDLATAAPGSRKLHRADPDIDDSIAELAYYRTALHLDPTRKPIAAPVGSR